MQIFYYWYVIGALAALMSISVIVTEGIPSAFAMMKKDVQVTLPSEIETKTADFANGLQHQQTTSGRLAVSQIAQEVNAEAEISNSTASNITSADAASASVHYIQNTKQLLKQASFEYGRGNSTGAGRLADLAYLDNFEHVETVLLNKGAAELKEEIESMMRQQLRVMLANGTSHDKVDIQINAINLKLDQAISIVPEFPGGLSVIALAVVISGAVLTSKTIRFRNCLARPDDKRPVDNKG